MNPLARNPTIACLACAWACAPTPIDDEPARRERPSIVLIVVDTLRADHADARRMPAVERLARDGVRFDEAFAHAPLTLPSHASLLSSQPPDRTRVVANGQAVGSLTLLPEWLGVHGYRTAAAISLATLWPTEPGRGLDRGFDRYVRGADLVASSDATGDRLAELVDELEGSDPFFLFAHFADPHEPYDAARPTGKADVQLDGETLARPSTSPSRQVRITRALGPGAHELAIDADEPFRVRRLGIAAECGALEPTWRRGSPDAFATEVVASFALQAASTVELDLWLHDRPADLAVRYEHEVRTVDRAVGRLFDDLRERGLYEDALIVFTSDHGEALGARGFVGHGEHLYDELLRVPLVIKAPRGHLLAPRLAQARGRLVRSIDVTPTILELAGLPALPDQVGGSVLSPGVAPLFAAARRTVAAPASGLSVALRDRQFKLVYDVDVDRHRLFDLTSDPGERSALAICPDDVRPGWAAELERRAAAFVAPVELDAAIQAGLAALGY